MRHTIYCGVLIIYNSFQSGEIDQSVLVHKTVEGKTLSVQHLSQTENNWIHAEVLITCFHLGRSIKTKYPSFINVANIPTSTAETRLQNVASNIQQQRHPRNLNSSSQL